MTTINNSENLIEKVGGIEKARRIAFDPLHPQMTHVSNDGRHWVNEAFAHIPEIQCQIESMIRIDDLRTAIAEHDTTQLCIGCGSPDLHKGGEIKEPKMCLDCFAEMVGFTRTSNGFIESDEVTDIRNHVSPSTIIKDLEAERHG